MSAAEASSWAEKLAKQKRDEREKDELKSRKILSDREVIGSGAAAMWQKIVTEVQAKVKLLHDAMGETVLRVELDHDKEGLTFFVASTGRNLFRIKYVKMSYTVATTDAEYHLAVEGVRELVWENPKYPGGTSSETIAHIYVERAFRAA